MKRKLIFYTLLAAFSFPAAMQAQMVQGRVSGYPAESPVYSEDRGWYITPELVNAFGEAEYDYYIPKNASYSYLQPLLTFSYRFSPYFSVGAGGGAGWLFTDAETGGGIYSFLYGTMLFSALKDSPVRPFLEIKSGTSKKFYFSLELGAKYNNWRMSAGVHQLPYYTLDYGYYTKFNISQAFFGIGIKYDIAFKKLNIALKKLK